MSGAASAIAAHLDVAQFERAGVIKRLSRESGLFVAAMIALSLMGLASDVVLSSYGLGLFLVALLPSLGLIVLGLWVDRQEPEPAWLLLRCLLWGATLSILVASLLNSLAAEFASESVTASVVAPLVEETVKAVAILWLLRHHRTHVYGRADAIVYALFVGVGFTIVEDFHYYMGAYADPEDSVLATVVARVPTTLLHPLFTAIIAVGLLLGSRRDGAWRYAIPVGAYIAAVVLHGLWNSEISWDIRIGVFLPLSCGLVYAAIAWSRRLERSRLDALLNSGLLSSRQAEALRTAVGSPRPGVWAWLAATRDPSHPYHLRWRVMQLAWISTSPEYSRHLAQSTGRSSSVQVADISAAAKQLLRVNLDRLADAHSMTDPGGTSRPDIRPTESVALWNSNAAILWSVLLTPVFGAYLQMRNWRALGQTGLEGAAKVWLWVSIVSIPTAALLGLLDLTRGEDSYLADIYRAAFFLVWYFSFARRQSKHLRDVMGGAYEKKPWLGVLLAGAALFIVVWALQSWILISLLPALRAAS